jgi:hypothetical protein
MRSDPMGLPKMKEKEVVLMKRILMLLTVVALMGARWYPRRTP